MPGPMPPAPNKGSTARGCGIAAVIVGVIIGGLALLGLIVGLVMQHQDDDSNSSGLGPTAPVVATHGHDSTLSTRTRATP